MRVFIISHDLSHNCLGRAVLLAHLLGVRHEVEIVGPCFGPDIWFPCRRAFKYRKVDGEIFLPQYTHLFARLIDKLKGDVVLAVKPRPTSFGVALLHRELTGRPIWLDVDDDEMAFYDEEDWRSWDRKILLRRPNSPLYTMLLQSQIPGADAITTASQTLRSRYGGALLPHVKDHEVLDPEKFDAVEERAKRNLPAGEKLILFAGLPRAHKGLDLLLSALQKLDRDDVRLVIVGATNDPDDPIETRLRKIGGERLYLLKQTAIGELPAVLSMADLVVLPQRATAVGRAQIPSKLFDAMSMALPIVATDVSDAAEVLDGGCGRIVPPGDETAMAEAIGDVLESPDEAKRMGRKARKRLIERYSFAAVQDQVDDILHCATRGSEKREAL